MKHYNTEKAQTAIFEKFGAFFAFSDDQFNAKKVEGVEYCDAGAGLIAPVGNSSKIWEEIENIQKIKVAWELENNTRQDIIWYNFGNFECQISMDYLDAVDSLSFYGITEKEVDDSWPAYFQMRIDNDHF